MALDYNKLYSEAVKRGDTGAANFYLKKLNETPIDMSKVTGVSGSLKGGVTEYTLADGTKTYRTATPEQVNAAISAVQNNATAQNATAGLVGNQGLTGNQIMSNDIMKYIQEYRDSLKASKIAALEKARQGALSSLSAEESTIAPQYASARQQTVALSDLGAKNFAEYLAKRGLRSSGAASQGQIAQNVALQNAMGDINLAESQAKADIARRRSDIETAYQTDLANVAAGVDTSILPMIIEQMNANRQYGLQEKQLGLQEAGLTGYYNPYANVQIPADIASEISKYSDNYQAEINRRMAINPNDPLIPYLQAARAQKIFNNPELLKQYGSEFMTTAAKQQQFENDLATRKFEESIRQFNIGQENWQRQFTYQQMQDKIQNALAAKRISLEQAQVALQQAKFKAEQDPDSLDNQYKRAQIEAMQGKGGLTYKDYVSMGRDMLDKGYWDSATSTYNKIYKPEQVRDWVLGLPLTVQEKTNLLNDLGIPK